MNLREKVENVREILYERRIYYLVCYIIGCAMSSLTIPENNHIGFVFISIENIAMGIILGNVFYYTYNKMPLYNVVFKIINYSLKYVLLIFILNFISYLLSLLGIDVIRYIMLYS